MKSRIAIPSGSTPPTRAGSGSRPATSCPLHLAGGGLREGGAGVGTTAAVRLPPHDGGWLLRQVQGVGPFRSDDPDSSRIFWSDGGVHQNLAFPVHPDPVSG